MFLQKLFVNICPPILYKFLIKLKRKESLPEYGYFGDYLSWAEALKQTVGYEDELILEKCKLALLKVKNGEVPYERDSVLFDKIEYSWPLVSSLLWIASRNNNNLNIIDFGGSLGSTYFQNLFFLKELNRLSWNIVEQRHFVQCGKDCFEDEYLKFYYTIEECLEKETADVILFSSVLQYLEEPYKLLHDVISRKIRYIIIDITGFIDSTDDRLTVQKVPPHIYNASYPAWFFNKDKFIDFFTGSYNLVAEFPGYIGEVINIDNKPLAGYRGFIFELKS